MSSTNSLAAAAPRRLALSFGLRDVGTLLGLSSLSLSSRR